MTQEEELTAEGGEVAALVVEGSGILQNVLLPPQVGTELAHRPVAEPQAEGIDDVHLLDGLVLMGIGKADAVVVTDVGLVGIGGHSSDLLCVAGEIGEKPQHLKHRCGSTIPVAGPFVATAIFRVGVDEDLGGLPDLPDGFCLARLVFLADEYAGQPVGAYPGVPVHAGLLPPIVLLDSRLEDAALYLTVDTLAEVGREHLVLDLSCREKEGQYYVVTDRWQKFTRQPFNEELLERLSGYCDEFLVHAVNVEGTGMGVDKTVLQCLAKHRNRPVTYAGGIGSLRDIETIAAIGEKRINYTVGSALDLFGGSLKLEEIISKY